MNQCDQSNQTTERWLQFAAYSILLPPYVVVGLTGNIILLLTFYKQSKREQTYRYQVFLTVSKTLEIILFGGFQSVSEYLSGQRGKPADWFHKNFTLMWIHYKIVLTSNIHMIMTSLMLAVAMSADRVYALAIPFRYKNIDHMKHQLIAASICFIASSIGLLFLTDVVPVGDHYIAQPNVRYVGSVFYAMTSGIGLFLRLVCVVALIALNVIMILAFRKRTLTIALMTNVQEKKEARKGADKTLFLLNVWQSVLMLFNQLPLISWHAAISAVPAVVCYRNTVSAIVDIFIFITDSIDLAVVMAINSKMRRAVFSAVKCGDDSQ